MDLNFQNGVSSDMVTVLINSSIVSGAEIVLKDYIESSTYKFQLILTDSPEVVSFFENANHVEKTVIMPWVLKKSNSRIISRIRNLCILIRQAIFLKQYVKVNNINILYANNTTAAVVAGMAKNCFNMNCITIVHIHDMMSASSFKQFIKFFCKNLHMITVSKCCKEELIKECSIEQNNIYVAYNGVPVDNHNFIKMNRDRDHKSENTVIGFAGSITKRKGLLYLAQAYKEMLERGKELYLEIAYNVIDDDYYNEVISVLDGCAYGIDTYPREKMSDFYNKIDILVVPSLKDPFPTAVLEAMNMQKLVLGSHVDGIVEMIDEKCQFEPANVDSLVSVMSRALSLSEQTTFDLVACNTRKLQNVFSIDKCTKTKDTILQSIINGD